MLLFSDPVGDISLSDLDTAVWIQSGQYPGSDFPYSQDFSEMGYIPDHFHKEEDSSTASDMNDSAYMSQPDTSRRSITTTEGSAPVRPQDSRTASYGPLYSNSLFSPALSSASSNHFQASRSDLGQMALPSAHDSDAARQTDLKDVNANANVFTTAPAFDFGTSSQSSWPATDAQQFSGNFAAGTLEMSPFTYQSTSYQSPFPMSYSNDIYAQQGHAQPPSVVGTSSRNVGYSRVPTPLSTADATSQFFIQDKSHYDLRNALVSPVSSMHPPFVTPQTFYNLQSSEESSEVKLAIPETSDRLDEGNDETFSASGDNSSIIVEESESTKLARTHPLYQACPNKEDDLYHCPHEGEAGCTHKPTKLKCNYDKYVDSHLRPFRCKVAACANTPFSSTACLLRHEREAHGMHGHGSKPHLCSFPDCERSILGNGFPRRYNLFDHMKRVHDFTGSSPLEQETAPVSQTAAKRQAGRKRKSSGTNEDEPDKRQKIETTESDSAIVEKRERAEAEKVQHRTLMRHRFNEQRQSVLAALSSVEGPYDHEGYHAFMTAAQSLKALIHQQQHTEMGSG